MCTQSSCTWCVKYFLSTCGRQNFKMVSMTFLTPGATAVFMLHHMAKGRLSRRD